MALWAIVVVGWLAMGAVGSYVARQKGRASGEGFLFGVLLGPLGVIVEGVLPTVGPPPARPRSPAEGTWGQPRGRPSRTGSGREPVERHVTGDEGAVDSRALAAVSMRSRPRHRPRHLPPRAQSIPPGLVFLC